MIPSSPVPPIQSSRWIISSRPLMENVLPLPVCPYANMLAAYPCSAESSSLCTPHLIITSGCVVSGERHALKSNVLFPTRSDRWSRDTDTISSSPRRSSFSLNGRTRTTTFTALAALRPVPLRFPELSTLCAGEEGAEPEPVRAGGRPIVPMPLGCAVSTTRRAARSVMRCSRLEGDPGGRDAYPGPPPIAGTACPFSSRRGWGRPEGTSGGMLRGADLLRANRGGALLPVVARGGVLGGGVSDTSTRSSPRVFCLFGTRSHATLFADLQDCGAS